MNSPAVVSNRKAYHNFHIIERIECGIGLVGCEVKSLRLGQVSLAESFARIENKEVWLYGAHIAPYEKTGSFAVDALRARKLLLRKRQIERLAGAVAQKGLTLIPLRIYFNKRGLAKIELALARGKRLYDKRESIKRKETEREIRREMKKRG